MNASALPASTVPAPVEPRVTQSRHVLRDGTVVVVRPIEAGDVDLEREFIQRLSPKARRYRFLGSISKPSEALLRQLTQPQLAHGVAYVALRGEGPEARVIGVCRYGTNSDAGSCECAVAVSDEWQRKGLATLLMHRLIDRARNSGFQRMYSIDAADNEEMRALAERLGFERKADPDDAKLVIHSLRL